MKVFFRNIHLYLSLAAGAVIMIACLTGAILVFEKELQEAFNHDRYYTSQPGIELPLKRVVGIVKQKYPDAKVAGVKVYDDPTRNIEIGLAIPEKGKIAEGPKAEPKEQKRDKSAGGKTQQPGPAEGRASHTAFVDPYTGKVVELYTYRETFFYKVFALHRWLLGSNDGVGKYIVGWATFIFLFILLTGMVLWWPKSRRILAQRIKLKWDGGWKRLNHDLHIVLGFYSAIFLFIFAFTAMSWSFKWFNKGIYSITKSSPESPEPPASVAQKKESIGLDEALRIARAKFPGVSYQLRTPKDSTGVFSVNVLPAGRMENASDTYFLDQYSGEVTGTLKFEEKNLGQRVRSYVKPIHTGSVFGAPSKVIAFIVCLLGTSFPITGVVMWLNRLKKSRGKA